MHICLDEACDDLLSVPTGTRSPEQAKTFAQRATVAGRRFWEPTDVQTFYGKRAGASSPGQLIGFDRGQPLYVTTNQQAVVDKKHVSGSARLSHGTRSVADGTVTADVIVTGTLTAERSWIQSVCMRLDAGAGVFDAQVHTLTLSEKRLEVRVQCTVDNCVSCQSNPPQLRHVDLQSKCHAAERCGVQRCVGTPIDMRKLACNIALVLLEPLNAVGIVMHSGWKLIASTIIGMVELTKPRQTKFAWEFPSHDMMQFNCLAKNTIVETASIIISSLNLVVRLVGFADNNYVDDRLRSSNLDSR